MAPYERLDAWKLAYAFALDVYRATTSFPKHELYGLTSQLRRAALSVALNIAEGSAKLGAREFRRYLDIALGSLAEVTCELRMARDLDLLDADSWQSLESQRNRAGDRDLETLQTRARKNALATAPPCSPTPPPSSLGFPPG